MSQELQLDQSNIFEKVIKKIVSSVDLAPETMPGVSLAAGQDAEVYCEVSYKGQATNIELQWRLRNDKNITWPANLELIPVISSPTIRMFFQSNICQLRPKSESTLKVNLQIPENMK